MDTNIENKIIGDFFIFSDFGNILGLLIFNILSGYMITLLNTIYQFELTLGVFIISLIIVFLNFIQILVARSKGACSNNSKELFNSYLSKSDKLPITKLSAIILLIVYFLGVSIVINRMNFQQDLILFYIPNIVILFAGFAFYGNSVIKSIVMIIYVKKQIPNQV